MVKTNRPPEVCLDSYVPIAKVYEERNTKEQVTIPDVSPSLYQMVMSGTVGSMPGNTNLYNYPDLGDDDDEAHEHPDYMKLDKMDIVEKEDFVENFTNNPNNYEKKEQSSEKTETKEGGSGEKSEDKESEPVG